jgi:tetratricopeptide (TPR) repeat protein
VLVALGVQTARRSAAYRDDLALWSAAVREAPQSLAAAWMLADRLGRDGRREEALAALGAAAARLREPSSRLRAQALLAAQQRRFSEALSDLADARAIREDPLFDEEVASLLLQAGRHADAVALLEPLVRSTPRSPERRYWVGVALAGAGRLPEALAQLREGCRVSRGRAQACAGLVVVLARMGRAAEARVALAEAIGVAPGDPRIQGWLDRSGVPDVR